MEIIRTNVLTDEELLAANVLIKVVQAFDQTHRTPYLSNQLNFDVDMPAFFLGYDEGKLVALLTVYADCHCYFGSPKSSSKGVCKGALA